MKATDVIQKIIFDATIDGVTYKDNECVYENDDDWSLTYEELHYEDNDSWCIVEIGGNVYDAQFYGDDEEKGLRSVLGGQLCLMEKDTDGYYIHTDIWYTGCCFSNIRFVSTTGEVKTLKKFHQY